jgi:hypothetical protein
MKKSKDYLARFFSGSLFSPSDPCRIFIKEFYSTPAVTGKLWPKLYEIKLRPVDGPADGSVEKLCPKASLY